MSFFLRSFNLHKAEYFCNTVNCTQDRTTLLVSTRRRSNEITEQWQAQTPGVRLIKVPVKRELSVVSFVKKFHISSLGQGFEIHTQLLHYDNIVNSNVLLTSARV